MYSQSSRTNLISRAEINIKNINPLLSHNNHLLKKDCTRLLPTDKIAQYFCPPTRLHNLMQRLTVPNMTVSISLDSRQHFENDKNDKSGSRTLTRLEHALQRNPETTLESVMMRGNLLISQSTYDLSV